MGEKLVQSAQTGVCSSSRALETHDAIGEKRAPTSSTTKYFIVLGIFTIVS